MLILVHKCFSFVTQKVDVVTTCFIRRRRKEMDCLCAFCGMKKGASGFWMRLCLLADDNLLDM
jgi:hypothetical protein